jgi:hypothetical protein
MTIFEEMTLGKRIASGIALMLMLMLVVGGGGILWSQPCRVGDGGLQTGECPSEAGGRF